MQNVDEQIVENGIEIDGSEATKYELIHESGIFVISFFFNLIGQGGKLFSSFSEFAYVNLTSLLLASCKWQR